MATWQQQQQMRDGEHSSRSTVSGTAASADAQYKVQRVGHSNSSSSCTGMKSATNALHMTADL
jgi:hypothetical protein